MEIVLFICTGNTCRSAMAEIYFNYKIKNIKSFKFYAESAGISAEDYWRISNGASYALSDHNIKVPEGYRSTFLTPLLLESSKYVFVMEKMHKDFITEHFPVYQKKVFLLSEIEDKIDNIADPLGFDNVFFQKTFLKIKHYIDKLIELLKNDTIGELDRRYKKDKEISTGSV